jgi:hypothetical protein
MEALAFDLSCGSMHSLSDIGSSTIQLSNGVTIHRPANLGVEAHSAALLEASALSRECFTSPTRQAKGQTCRKEFFFKQPRSRVMGHREWEVMPLAKPTHDPHICLKCSPPSSVPVSDLRDTQKDPKANGGITSGQWIYINASMFAIGTQGSDIWHTEYFRQCAIIVILLTSLGDGFFSLGL